MPALLLLLLLLLSVADWSDHSKRLTLAIPEQTNNVTHCRGSTCFRCHFVHADACQLQGSQQQSVLDLELRPIVVILQHLQTCGTLAVHHVIGNLR